MNRSLSQDLAVAVARIVFLLIYNHLIHLDSPTQRLQRSYFEQALEAQ